MAIRNATYDLDSTARANVKAYSAAGIAAAGASRASATADEISIFPTVVAALRGRGIEDPLGILVAEYYRASGSSFYNHETATALGATDDRSQEGV